MGWFLILAMALALLAALWRFGHLGGGPLQFLLSALLLALAGYAWQGAPDRPGSPKATAGEASVAPGPFATMRRDIFGGFDRADRWLTMSESFQRNGNARDAAGILRSGLRANPRDAILWTGYADALVQHGGGLNPAADLAFRRAQGLAPDHPGPLLFHGIALFQVGRLGEAEQAWRAALIRAPAEAQWRPALEEQLALIAQARAAGQIP